MYVGTAVMWIVNEPSRSTQILHRYFIAFTNLLYFFHIIMPKKIMTRDIKRDWNQVW